MRGVPRLVQMAMTATREMATASGGKGRKVAVLGAAGGIGQPLSMLMKVANSWIYVWRAACAGRTLLT